MIRVHADRRPVRRNRRSDAPDQTTMWPGALIEMVPPFAPVACESVIGLEPTNTMPCARHSGVAGGVAAVLRHRPGTRDTVLLNDTVPPFASVD